MFSSGVDAAQPTVIYFYRSVLDQTLAQIRSRRPQESGCHLPIPQNVYDSGYDPEEKEIEL